MTKKNSFEVRLSIIQHISKMMLEMAYIDFDKLSPEDEKIMLEDYEEVAGHLLDSVTFTPSESEDGVSFTAQFTIIDPEKYIQDFLEENPTP